MSIEIFAAGPEVRQMVDEIKGLNHPHLEIAKVAVQFVNSKPFVKERLNIGKITKFSKSAKLWHPSNNRFDFCLSLCVDVWHGLLNDQQRRALVDLHLSRCKVEYEPVTEVINGKRTVIKDEWGRKEYTETIKTDDEGAPCWKIEPLDLQVFSENVGRYGLWYDDLVNFKIAIEESENDADKA